ncbi:MAG TPA: hypothetical protein VFH47_04945, partial [Candidatus Thermoplasmatota archaeon]|nr:hypothetical protein [Candidatus Thermoplasmatota archaeon]
PSPPPAVPQPPAASPAPPSLEPVPAAAPAAPAPPPPAAPPPAPVVVPSDTQGAPELVTIRALADIPPFVGPDMQTYLLKAGDIASVPPSIAQLLERRKKAQLVEGF